MPLTARQGFWIVLLCGLVMRVCFILGTRPYHIVDGTEEVAIAHSLAEHNAFADPFREPTGPTAHSAPAYPMLLSLVYRVAGKNARLAELVKEGLSSSVSAVQFALLPALAVAAGLPLAAGLCAGLLGALLPLHPYIEVKGEWTAPYAGVVLLCLTALMVWSWRKEDRGLRHALWRGAALGAALWFTPVFLPVILLWLSVEWMWFGRSAPQARRAALAAAAIVLLLQVPWTIRNTVRLGAPIWSRDNLGLELHLAFQDHAKAYYLATRANLERNGAVWTHPNSAPEEAARLRALGEVTYNAQAQTEAVRWIRAHSAAAARLVGERTLLFWFPLYEGLFRSGIACVLTLAAWWGWWRMRQRSLPMFILLGGIWLGYPVVYYLLQNEPRYAYPMFWSKLLAAGFLLASLGEGFQAKESALPRQGEPQQSAAANPPPY